MALIAWDLLDLINKAPQGTKIWVLQTRERRKMVVISVMFEHPIEGLILFETGCGKDCPGAWGAPVNDIFARVDTEDQELDIEIPSTTDTDIGPCWRTELKHAFYSVTTKSDLGAYLPHYMKFDLAAKTSVCLG
ncbi:hypothetical protein LTR16_001084, partial [Cryomyces antarcticus]